YYDFFFFFSSRRRHTRSKRDWSSDVCSSDLIFAVRFLLTDGIEGQTIKLRQIDCLHKYLNLLRLRHCRKLHFFRSKHLLFLLLCQLVFLIDRPDTFGIQEMPGEMYKLLRHRLSPILLRIQGGIFSVFSWSCHIPVFRCNQWLIVHLR